MGDGINKANKESDQLTLNSVIFELEHVHNISLKMFDKHVMKILELLPKNTVKKYVRKLEL